MTPDQYLLSPTSFSVPQAALRNPKPLPLELPGPLSEPLLPVSEVRLTLACLSAGSQSGIWLRGLRSRRIRARVAPAHISAASLVHFCIRSVFQSPIHLSNQLRYPQCGLFVLPCHTLSSWCGILPLHSNHTTLLPLLKCPLLPRDFTKQWRRDLIWKRVRPTMT